MKPFSHPLLGVAGRILGSHVPRTPESERLRQRKRGQYGFLERVGQTLDPTQTQREKAETAYSAVGEWLAGSTALSSALIYLQGSEAIGTTNKPVLDHEHDVDLLCFVRDWTNVEPPSVLKKIVGDRLREHGTYRLLLQEKQRCWRLDYAGAFHLDITPSIPNPACSNGGELVPDKSQRCWKPSNPRGYRDWFIFRASFDPISVAVNKTDEQARADVEPFPDKLVRKGILRCVVQLLKRHRDIWFAKDADGLAPISIIITTLAAHAYYHCANNYSYDNELDLFCDTIRFMPHFIEPSYVQDALIGKVMNPTTVGENFAEKWASDPRKAKAYRDWNAAALETFERLSAAVGRDEVAVHLSKSLGSAQVEKAMASETLERSNARETGRLVVAPSVGLVTSNVGTPVRANTFYGRK